MISSLKTIEKNLSKCEITDENNWISLVNPTMEELDIISSKTGAFLDFLEAPLDPEERPRIDIEDNQILIIINVPIEKEEGDNLIIYDTMPLGILIVDNHFITIALDEVDCLNDFKIKDTKNLNTFKRTRFTLQILYKTATYYLKYLKHIDRKTGEVERSLHGALKNEQLIKLLGLEKSLVYFTTSLKSNAIVMKKLFRTNVIPMYEEDEDLLEDVLTEVNQAIDMSEINSNILSGMMDAFASIISNNLNVVMKILASITILMTIPTIIFSYYGMNVYFPGNDFKYMYLVLIGCTGLIMGITFYFLKKKGML